MSKHGYRKGGLRDKYIISKTSGNPVDPKAKYFVLRYDVDPHARKAMEAYCDSVVKDNMKLAQDIDIALSETAIQFAENQIESTP